ncbi:MAG: hypothetical protein NTU43_11825 [Bacteroidetes bacterium]|nr:hypothetical protein [Bacteroidota bacterium]
MMPKKWFLLTACFLLTQLSYSQNLNDNLIFDPQVKTVILSKAGSEDRYAIIGLNTSEQ